VSSSPGPEPEPELELDPGRNPALSLLTMLLIDIAAPIGVFYGLRAAGVGALPSLWLSAVPPATKSVLEVVRRRTLDRLAVFAVGMTVLSVGVALISGTPRVLLLRDGWLTAVGGVAFLLTVRGPRPLAFMFSRPLLERRYHRSSGSWDGLWARDAGFRRIWRVSTAVWGIGLLLDSAVRTVIAYTAPVDLVPALNGIQYGVFTLLMIVIVNLQQSRSGLTRILDGRPDPGAATQPAAT